jgi:adenosylhomocysteine nucleosidase
VSRVLVLTAADLEARGLAARLGLPQVPGRDWPDFAAGALEIVAVGVRGALLEPRTRDLRPATLVVSAGVCGALAPGLEAGDLVIPEAVVTTDGQRYPLIALPGLRARGTLLGARDVVGSVVAKARLWVETGAVAVDLESAVIAAWAGARGLPAAVVRGVSDPADQGVGPDLATVVADDGRLRPMRAVSALLGRPRAFSEAVALRRGTAVALKSVASALGRIARAMN